MGMLTAAADLKVVAVTNGSSGGKITSLCKQEFGKQPPNCFAYTLGRECCFPHDITYHSIYSNGSPDESARAKLQLQLGIGITW